MLSLEIEIRNALSNRRCYLNKFTFASWLQKVISKKFSIWNSFTIFWFFKRWWDKNRFLLTPRRVMLIFLLNNTLRIHNVWKSRYFWMIVLKKRFSSILWWKSNWKVWTIFLYWMLRTDYLSLNLICSTGTKNTHFL